MHRSGYMFDFVWNGDYDNIAIEDTIYDVFANHGLNVSSVNFDSVDYGDTKYNRNGNKTTQCYVSFTWSTDYDDYKIDTDIESAMDSLGYEVIGSNFEGE